MGTILEGHIITTIHIQTQSTDTTITLFIHHTDLLSLTQWQLTLAQGALHLTAEVFSFVG